MKRFLLYSLAALNVAIMGLGQPTAAVADTYQVFVGYADGLRGGGFFPGIWQGDPGVTFEGGTSSAFDAGAILIHNPGGVSLTVNNVAVIVDGQAYVPPWTFPVVLAPGGNLILTQTFDYNFDTSDYHQVGGANPGNPAVDCSIICPTVTVTTDGITSTVFQDSGHVLDTGGFDLAGYGFNESFRWRLIGEAAGCIGQGCSNEGLLGVPGPIAGAGLPGMVFACGGLLAWWRRKRTAFGALAAA
jgi:hypothetical protein